jgi:hypothetical protein
MAYEIAYEEYSIHVSWVDCCAEANDRMKAPIQPRTVMAWNQRFRATETFPHPHENEKSSMPFVFRNYLAAETIARAEMRRLKKTDAVSRDCSGLL